MNLNHATNKENGSTLSAAEWNSLAADVNELGAGGTGGSSNVIIADDTVTDPSAGVSIATAVDQVGTAKVIELTKKKKGVNTTIVSDNNINLEPRASVESTKGGNISFKPGDDIEFCSHHRILDNQDEVSIKVIDGEDIPVKLQLNAAEMTLTTKDKVGDDANVFDINVNSGKNTKGYLKVRAITLGYNFENLKAIKDVGISRLRLYATIQNPFVLFSPFNNESGLDPETNSWSNENTAVGYSFGSHRMPIVGYNTPSTRNFIFGLNVTF